MGLNHLWLYILLFWYVVNLQKLCKYNLIHTIRIPHHLQCFGSLKLWLCRLWSFFYCTICIIFSKKRSRFRKWRTWWNVRNRSMTRCLGNSACIMTNQKCQAVPMMMPMMPTLRWKMSWNDIWWSSMRHHSNSHHSNSHWINCSPIIFNPTSQN